MLVYIGLLGLIIFILAMCFSWIVWYGTVFSDIAEDCQFVINKYMNKNKNEQ